MKHCSRIIALSALIIASIIHTDPLTQTLIPFAKQAYGLVFKYPIMLKPGLLQESESPALSQHKVRILELFDIFSPETISKAILLDDDYFRSNIDLGNLKHLIAIIIHEHTHLDQNHSLLEAMFELKIENALNRNKPVRIDGKPFTKELFESKKLALSRHHEELADAGNKPYLDLCYHQHLYFNKRAQEEDAYLSNALMQEKDPAQQTLIRNFLQHYQSNDPECLKSIEDGPHPTPRRRALYFKEWWQDSSLRK